MNSNLFKGYDSIFAVRLRELMYKHGTTQQVLADVLHIQRQTVSHYISGIALPGIDKICDIAKFFKVSSDYLLGITNATSQDLELKYICEYTGLDEKTVRTLRVIKVCSPAFTKILKQIIKEPGIEKPCQSLLDIIYFFYHCTIASNNNLDKYGINNKGEIKAISDLKSNNEIYHVIDDKVKEKIYLEKIKDTLVQLKKDYWEDIKGIEKITKEKRTRKPNKIKEGLKQDGN